MKLQVQRSHFCLNNSDFCTYIRAAAVTCCPPMVASSNISCSPAREVLLPASATRTWVTYPASSLGSVQRGASYFNDELVVHEYVGADLVLLYARVMMNWLTSTPMQISVFLYTLYKSKYEIYLLMWIHCLRNSYDAGEESSHDHLYLPCLEVQRLKPTMFTG